MGKCDLPIYNRNYVGNGRLFGCRLQPPTFYLANIGKCGTYIPILPVLREKKLREREKGGNHFGRFSGGGGGGGRRE